MIGTRRDLAVGIGLVLAIGSLVMLFNLGKMHGNAVGCAFSVPFLSAAFLFYGFTGRAIWRRRRD